MRGALGLTKATVASPKTIPPLVAVVVTLIPSGFACFLRTLTHTHDGLPRRQKGKLRVSVKGVTSAVRAGLGRRLYRAYLLAAALAACPTVVATGPDKLAQ